MTIFQQCFIIQQYLNKEALRYIKMAADKGDSVARSYYADMLTNGIGNEARYSENKKYNQISNEDYSKEDSV